MIFATGGVALGDISTKSNPASSAAFKASSREITPICSPLSPITRNSEARIASLIRTDLLMSNDSYFVTFIVSQQSF